MTCMMAGKLGQPPLLQGAAVWRHIALLETAKLDSRMPRRQSIYPDGYSCNVVCRLTSWEAPLQIVEREVEARQAFHALGPAPSQPCEAIFRQV